MLRLPLVLLAVLPLACEQPNATGLLPGGLDGSADRPDAAAPTADAAPDSGVDSGGITTPPRDGPPPPDAASPADGPPAPADAPPPPECTATQLSCTADGTTVLTCSPQGRWVMGPSCGDDVCSAGICVCRRDRCDEGTIHSAAGWVEAVAAGGRSLFYAVNGTSARIQRLDLASREDETIQSGDTGYVRYALDTHQGNLIWCSDIRVSTDRGGQLVYGTSQLESGFCEQVKRVDDLIYYKGERLYRKRLDDSPREVVSDELMSRFELAGSHLYFVGSTDDDDKSFIKRFPLSNPSQVETLVDAVETIFKELIVDGTHVYVVADDRLLRVPLAGVRNPEVFWREPNANPWAMVQTPTHLYWSATAVSNSVCLEAQVWRRAKSGGPAEVVSAVTGHCAGPLVLLDNHIYAAVALLSGLAPLGPTQLRRIRL
jgi:hypothetical protein